MTHEELWKVVLAHMEDRVSRANFATWLRGSQLVQRNDDALTVGVANNFAREWVENKYHKDILGIARTVDASIKRIDYLVLHQGEAPPLPRPSQRADRAQLAEGRMQLDFSVDAATGLNARYTLDTFIVGSSNELAHAAACAIIQDVGTKYNPFFVYGGVGLGKTHLIQAIGNELRTKSKGLVRPRYVTSESFTHDVVWGIRNKRMDDIRKKYRDTDVLIIDDIQFIGGKEKTEEEFFHTFNALYEHGKQIIISSDRPPHAIPTLEERLRSRFEGGLIADISFPEFETRVAIVRSKLQARNATLPDAVIDLVAEQVRKNIRELEGVLNKLIFHQERKQAPLTTDAARDIIEKLIRSMTKPVTEAQILQAVSDFYSINAQDLVSRSRRKQVVEPRQIVMYLLRDLLTLSYPYIGEKMGRDHTTAIHSYEKIAAEVHKNPAMNQKLYQIKELITKS